MHFSPHICLLRFKNKIHFSFVLWHFSVICYDFTTNCNAVTSQIYLKMITSHDFNNCYICPLKEVRWLLPEILITGWSFVWFSLPPLSIWITQPREGISGNLNRKVCTVGTISTLLFSIFTLGIGLLIETGSL